MKFQESFDFDYASHTILRMFTDRDYYKKKYEEMGGSPEILDCDDQGGRFSITVRHALDTSNMKIPDIVKNRIGDRLLLRQTDSWTPANAHGRIDIAIEKTPATAEIAMRLADRGNTARLTLDFDIQVSIPLLGGRIEKGIAQPMTRHLHRDLTVSNRLAAAYG